ncbi:hypothetical protein Cst_c10560 [Thermoclostridium stercorarium subsp. stercorarium DSM 8532]|uniref:Uncharacterized protein n=1 Tax=Thermoclostridium stercorarium (strain ATCC 35414 / DSM 8532 / NCIMB 11754) TaxID=1121335 RepID=L7VN11_THES1|nr:hypothetical protein Cst_c10560 [Thermoclostridium stercorarium subsp. stercorarium DSM 8532]
MCFKLHNATNVNIRIYEKDKITKAPELLQNSGALFFNRLL